ncbi:MAG: hypothetical protein WCG73_01455 [Candidatus Moraniibacteriota bacterium]
MVEDTLSVKDAIQHLAQYYKICPEEYIVLDRAGLESKIPHRDIALCLDFGFIPLNKDSFHAIGVSYIHDDSPELTGHFPGKKILPGHWIEEKMNLTAALLTNRLMPEGKNGRTYLPMITKTHEKTFLRSISPVSIVAVMAQYLPEGQRFQVGNNVVESVSKQRPIFSASVYVNGISCAEACFSAILKPIRG